ncbi:hypothetical protein [Curtobacterium sp. BH-2-1-1]|jgi:hypothetical protein|uniref:hypothetical protein n=1 Tax=Curtobacterium sp. BH-2-1-1 TaxID=1905847 RepID=UPI0011AA9194|nr:hypothetical protein [Curtobacterium sp. BH-2-1-1]
MRKNATIATVLLAVSIPVLIGCAIQANALFDLVDRTGTDGGAGAFTIVLGLAAFIAFVAGIGFTLTALVQRADQRHFHTVH